MRLRPYQTQAIEQTFAAWQEARSLLGVAATGTGKTVIAASVIARHPGRTMVVAHREELIFQAADRIQKVTGLEPDIEMAEMRAAEFSLTGKARVVISTIQTQVAGSNGGRMTRFDPSEFSLLVIDEAHHAVAKTYRRVIDHYRTNPDLQVLGVTATPDRADEEALGRVFEAVAWEFDIRFGITDGWLVPIRQRMVQADGLDLSQVRTTAGDLNGADLARVMEYEVPLHEIVGPTIELAGNRKTLIFAASLAHADRICEILNRHRADSARWVHGGTPKAERRQLFRDYARGEFQYLVNVGVATEGFDDPGVAVVVMARPTKSRALYTQMIGRGIRPLAGIVDHADLWDSAERRCRAIGDSDKPFVEIIDFVGNAGRHRLITTADILGGNVSDEVIEKARARLRREGGGDAMQALASAESEIQAERERARQAEAARRAKLTAKVRFRMQVIDLFDVFGLTPWRERGWEKGRQPSQKMVDLLEQQGIRTRGLTFARARQLIQEITSRWDSDRCSFKQARILASRGLPTNVTRERARELIDAIATKEGWQSRKKKAPAHAETAVYPY